MTTLQQLKPARKPGATRRADMTPVVKEMRNTIFGNNPNRIRRECWGATSEDGVWEFHREDEPGTPWYIKHAPTGLIVSVVFGTLNKARLYTGRGHATRDIQAQQREYQAAAIRADNIPAQRDSAHPAWCAHQHEAGVAQCGGTHISDHTTVAASGAGSHGQAAVTSVLDQGTPTVDLAVRTLAENPLFDEETTIRITPRQAESLAARLIYAAQIAREASYE